MKIDPITPKPSDYNVTSTLDNDKDDLHTTYSCKHCSRILFHKEQDELTDKHVWTCIKCNLDS